MLCYVSSLQPVIKVVLLFNKFQGAHFPLDIVPICDTSFWSCRHQVSLLSISVTAVARSLASLPVRLSSWSLRKFLTFQVFSFVPFYSGRYSPLYLLVLPDGLLTPGVYSLLCDSMLFSLVSFPLFPASSSGSAIFLANVHVQLFIFSRFHSFNFLTFQVSWTEIQGES